MPPINLHTKLTHTWKHAPGKTRGTCQRCGVSYQKVLLDIPVARVDSDGRPYFQEMARTWTSSTGRKYESHKTPPCVVVATKSKYTRLRENADGTSQLSLVLDSGTPNPIPVSNGPQQANQAPANGILVDDPDKHPVSVLLEHSQRTKGPPPKFTYEISGVSYAPTITCVCTYLGKAVRVVAGSKQDAKRASAEGLIKSLS